MTEKKPILVLEPHGDPHGRGFWANESRDGGITFYHLGGLGAQSRRAWRAYARHWGYTLREWRNRGLAAQYDGFPERKSDL